MTAPPISRYPVPSLDALPEDLRVRMLEVQEKASSWRSRTDPRSSARFSRITTR